MVSTVSIGQTDLVALAKSGDHGAFSALLQPLIPSAYRLAAAMLRDAHAAEDVVQESSLKAWRKIAQLNGDGEMRPWFFGIVANECRSTRRTKWWSVLKLEAPEPVGEPAADVVAEFADLRRAIRRLKYRRRLLLVLHWYLDLPVAEIADLTHSSEDAVKSELSRAVRQLRSLLWAVEG